MAEVNRKKVLILGGLSSDEGPQTPYAEQFGNIMPEYDFEELRFDHLIFEITPEKFSITDGRSGAALSAADVVMLRGKIRKSSGLAYLVSQYCQLTNTLFFNDYSNYRPSSKLAQAALFYQQQVPFPATYFSVKPEFLQRCITAYLGFPCIVKDNYGSHGKHNYLVKDEAMLERLLKDNPDTEFLAQRFCENNGDYRVLVMGDQEPLQIWRQASGDSHLNNTSQGGTGTLVHDLSAETIAEAQRIAKALKMSIAGVDLLRDSATGQLYFLEVNSQPQLLSGAFVPEKAAEIRKFIRSRLGGD